MKNKKPNNSAHSPDLQNYELLVKTCILLFEFRNSYFCPIFRLILYCYLNLFLPFLSLGFFLTFKLSGAVTTAWPLPSVTSLLPLLLSLTTGVLSSSSELFRSSKPFGIDDDPNPSNIIILIRCCHYSANLLYKWTVIWLEISRIKLNHIHYNRINFGYNYFQFEWTFTYFL